MIPLRDFISAGHAILTVELPASRTADHAGQPVRPHYTYKVEAPAEQNPGRDVRFVKLLVGPDNGSDYAYLGLLLEDGRLRATRASKLRHDSFPFRLLARVASAAWEGPAGEARIAAGGYRVHHEGRCCRCGRRLTVPRSIEDGIGPVCRAGGIDVDRD